jgi:hypothetical protein
MKYRIPFIFFLFIQVYLMAQVDSASLNSYIILLDENLMKVEDSMGNLIFLKQFFRPFKYFADIDTDQIDELIVVDSTLTNGKLNFIIYFYDGEEDFYLIDSIFSGSFFPFVTYSEEIKCMIIETGIPDFDIFNQQSATDYLPINLWEIQNDDLFLVNDELYEPFIFENNNLIQLIDYYSRENTFDCKTSQLYKGLIASAFTNYISAGEQSLATQFLKKYYLCEDIESFKQEILDLIYPKANK